MYCFNERFDDAVHLLEQWQSAKGEPEEFMFFKLLGEASLGVGRHAVAIRYLQRSLQLYPRNADSLSMLGLLYVLEEEGAKVGLDLCDRAIIMDESEVEHMYRRAVALFHLKRYEDSLVSVRKVVQRQKNHDRAVLLRGEIYENLGFKSRAEQSFQRVLTINSAGENRIKQARNYLKKLTKNK
jgi:tetratricopeptide (TPR) repeat protein